MTSLNKTGTGTGRFEIRFVFFSDVDVVRHELVRKIVRAYESESDA